MLAALQKYFGYDRFLDNQQEIIARILRGEDLCVVMPTGAGKSLCYQLPALMKNGYSVIVSPLISLMKDQIDQLRQKGIAAGCINSSIPLREQQQCISDVITGKIKLLYVAPERFSAFSFRSLMENCPPEMLVIDEAHCISQWGHDFRPSYLKIGEFAKLYQIKQICAFTATATPQVRKDIKTQLCRENMNIIAAGFKRPNLAFAVVPCSRQENKFAAIRKLLQKPAPTIIYCATRKNVEDIAAEFNCIAYHAGMNDDERKSAQDMFMNDPCPVLAATNAFGMGIDRKDVRRIIHYNMPSSLEAYYQEAGRAGRDGENSECVLLFSYSDKFVHEFMIELNNPPQAAVAELWSLLLRLSNEKQTHSLEISASELSDLLHECKNDSMTSAALAILEKNNFIERGYRTQNAGNITFFGNLNQLAGQHCLEKTQRSRFISRMIKYYGNALTGKLSCTYNEMAAIVNLSVEQTKRVIRALNEDILIWDAPFAGRSIEIIAPDKSISEIDFTALKEKHDFELSRLQQVIKYANTYNCRQAFITDYFGEDVGSWQCGSCDCCSTNSTSAFKKNLTESEKKVFTIILKAIDHFNDKLGAGKISAILAGSMRADIVEFHYDRSPMFGKLVFLKQSQISSYIHQMESAGLIGKTDSRFPCLQMTAKGYECLKHPDRFPPM